MFNMQVVCHVFFKKKQKITSSSTESRISFLKKVSYTPGLPHKPFSFVDRKKKTNELQSPLCWSLNCWIFFIQLLLQVNLDFCDRNLQNKKYYL